MVRKLPANCRDIVPTNCRDYITTICDGWRCAKALEPRVAAAAAARAQHLRGQGRRSAPSGRAEPSGSSVARAAGSRDRRAAAYGWARRAARGNAQRDGDEVGAASRLDAEALHFLRLSFMDACGVGTR